MTTGVLSCGLLLSNPSPFTSNTQEKESHHEESVCVVKFAANCNDGIRPGKWKSDLRKQWLLWFQASVASQQWHAGKFVLRLCHRSVCFDESEAGRVCGGLRS